MVWRFDPKQTFTRDAWRRHEAGLGNGGIEMVSRRIAFVTIGQTPRDDIVPEMVSEISAGTAGAKVHVDEFGVLDGLSADDLGKMMAGEGEASFATRMADGREVVTSKDRTEDRLNHMLGEIDKAGFDLVVLLCTGTAIVPLKDTLVVEAQRIVDATAGALAASARRVGVIVPLERQVAQFTMRHAAMTPAKVIAASPYSNDDLKARAAAMRDCDLIVMHCMGYSAAMFEQVRSSVDAPVLLSRRIVAGVVRQML